MMHTYNGEPVLACGHTEREHQELGGNVFCISARGREHTKTVAVADQAVVHQAEINALVASYVTAKKALHDAVLLLDWLRREGMGSWTPANTAQLEEWRELAREK